MMRRGWVPSKGSLCKLKKPFKVWEGTKTRELLGGIEENNAPYEGSLICPPLRQINDVLQKSLLKRIELVARPFSILLCSKHRQQVSSSLRCESRAWKGKISVLCKSCYKKFSYFNHVAFNLTIHNEPAVKIQAGLAHLPCILNNRQKPSSGSVHCISTNLDFYFWILYTRWKDN